MHWVEQFRGLLPRPRYEVSLAFCFSGAVNAMGGSHCRGILIPSEKPLNPDDESFVSWDVRLVPV